MKLFSSWQGEVMLIVLLDHIPKERDRESERKRIRLLGCRDRATLGTCWSLVFSYTCLYVWCVWLIWQDTSWAPRDAVGSITTFTSCRQAHLITKKCVSENHKPSSQSYTDILWKMTCITACHVLYLFDQQLFFVFLVMLSSDEWAAVLLIEHFLTPFAWSFIILSQKSHILVLSFQKERQHFKKIIL